MKLAIMLNSSGDFRADVLRVRELEKAGVDLVWIPEAYGFDSVSLMGYLAAQTSSIQIGSGILNVFSRSAACIAQTAAGMDLVSGGRFVLGLGASGPQVIEGFHGTPYHRPMPRVRDYINMCRLAWRGEPLVYDGAAVTVPLPAGQGTGMGKALKLIHRPENSSIAIFWASLMGGSVSETARLADGWLPFFFDPDKFNTVWGEDLQRGLAERDPALGPLQIAAGGALAIGDELSGEGGERVLDRERAAYARYIGGMGARDKNFYNSICQRYGYVKEAAQIQDLYLAGRRDEAAQAVPFDMLQHTNLVGPAGFVMERIAAYREAGVTLLQVRPVGDDIGAIERLRALMA